MSDSPRPISPAKSRQKNRSRAGGGRRRASALLAATTATAAALALGGLATPAFAADPVLIDVLTTNDFHGRLEANPPAAGAAVLGGMVDAYEAANPNTLLVGAGDLIGASTFTSFIQQDQPTIDAMNAIGLDASALGNHEFDQGTADLENRVIPAADWPYLSANVYKKGTQDPAFQEYEVREFDGVSVGFVGAVTEELSSLVSPAGIATIDVGPIVPAVNRVADQLSDGDESNGEADVIMLLVHEGAATPDIASATDNSVFGRLVSGVDANVDAIVSAHTHLAYNHQIPVTGSNKVRPVISAGQYGENYGHLALSVDPDSGELLKVTSEVLPLAGAFAPDPAVEKIVADAVAVAEVQGSVTVGEITADFNRAAQSTGEENRGGESPLGNFVADVQLWSTEDAGSEIALMNPGGLRADLDFDANPLVVGDADGVVTYQEAAAVQPFANTLVALDLTTEQLKSVLDEQWQPADASRPFLKLGLSKGIEYTYDPTAPAGEHIEAVWVNGELAAAGQTWRTTVNSFLASGGDNFTTFAEGTNRSDTGKIDLQSMVDYFDEFGSASPDYSQRSVGVVASLAGLTAGSTASIDVSSLLFSNGEPVADTVTVSLVGAVIGSAAIDPSIVDTTDEVGRATVPLTLPRGVSGDQLLEIAVPGTDTAISVPVAIAAAAAEEPSTIYASWGPRLVKRGADLTVRVLVNSAGVVAGGTVEYFDRGRVVATSVTDAAGRSTTTIENLGRGVHVLKARFTGVDGVSASITPSRVVVAY